MPKSKYSTGLEGRRFNRTVIVRFSHLVITKHETRYYWFCQCDCGKEHIADVRAMIRGHVQSCGCFKAIRARQQFTVHGHCVDKKRTPEANSWKKMRARCYDPNNEWFHRYGGRGVIVCEGFDSFTHFLFLLGHKPSPIYSIDRIDNNGHYSCGECPQCAVNNWPMNCRWATPQEQANNMTSNRYLTFNGKTQTIAQWAREQGISYKKLHNRIHREWPLERALLTP